MNRYGVRSPATHIFSGQDVALLLQRRVEERAAHPFVVWEPFEGPCRQWTYAELGAEVDRVASGLAARGVQAGERVLIHLENSPEFLLTWLACAVIGAVAVTTNTRSAGAELSYFAQHSEAVAAVTQPAYADLVAGAAPGLRWIAVTDTDAGAAPAPGTGPGADTSFAALRGEPAGLVRRPPDALAPMSVQYTSGTTDRPKGVLWTHANALWGARTNAVHEGLRADDVHLLFSPLFHTNALAYSFLATLWAGATVVVQPRFSARRFWDVSVRNRCTWSCVHGFGVRALLEHPVPDEHHYRLWGVGGADLPIDPYFRLRSLGWWGMTETMTTPIVSDLDRPNPPLSIGRAAPEYQIAVVDEAGDPVGPDEVGHLLVSGVRGLSLFAEYLDEPEVTASCFDEHGWFRTGDLVSVDADGYLTFRDRAKDVLRVGGENVAASEVERVVSSVPGVMEAAVVAGPHPMLDEVPIAFVVAPGATPELPEQIIEACRAALAGFKVPRAVHVVDDLPRSLLGKVAKVELRERLRAEGAG